MPTNRLNISIVDEETIKELTKLRKQLESFHSDKRFSLADVVKILIISKPSLRDLTLNS